MATAKKTTKGTTNKPITKKPGYVKQNNPKIDERYRWESGAGVCAISDLKPIKRGK